MLGHHGWEGRSRTKRLRRTKNNVLLRPLEAWSVTLHPISHCRHADHKFASVWGVGKVVAAVLFRVYKRRRSLCSMLLPCSHVHHFMAVARRYTASRRQGERGFRTAIWTFAAGSLVTLVFCPRLCPGCTILRWEARNHSVVSPLPDMCAPLPHLYLLVVRRVRLVSELVNLIVCQRSAQVLFDLHVRPEGNIVARRMCRCCRQDRQQAKGGSEVGRRDNMVTLGCKTKHQEPSHSRSNRQEHHS